MKTIYPLMILYYLMLTGCTNIDAYDWLHINQNNSPRVYNNSYNKLIGNNELIIVSINPHNNFNKDTINILKSKYEQNLQSLGYHIIETNSHKKPTIIAQIDLDREAKTGTKQVDECSYQDVQVYTDKGFVTQSQNVCTPTTQYYTYYRYENKITFIKSPSICNNSTKKNPYCTSQNSEAIYTSSGIDTSLDINDTLIFIRLTEAILATYPSNQSYDVYSTNTLMGYQPAILFKTRS